jgi:co-chaperonin GroES (HSP10)
MTNIVPLGGLVLFEEMQEQDTTTKSGLVLAASASNSSLSRGKVIKLGPGERDQDDNEHPIPLNIGDIIIYSDIQATEITDNQGNKYKFINWRQLFGTENNA